MRSLRVNSGAWHGDYTWCQSLSAGARLHLLLTVGRQNERVLSGTHKSKEAVAVFTRSGGFSFCEVASHKEREHHERHRCYTQADSDRNWTTALKIAGKNITKPLCGVRSSNGFVSWTDQERSGAFTLSRHGWRAMKLAY
jgi:hypothetical protein